MIGRSGMGKMENCGARPWTSEVEASARAKAQVPSEKGARDRKDPSARPFAVAMGASQAVFGESVRL